MAAADDAPILTIRSRADLRLWLGANLAHVTNSTAKNTMAPVDLSPENCFAWAGSTRSPGRWILDADRSIILIGPRNVTSGWLAIDKAHAERARAKGAMTSAGEAKNAVAMAKGMWNFLNNVDALQAPADMIGAQTAAGATAG